MEILISDINNVIKNTYISKKYIGIFVKLINYHLKLGNTTKKYVIEKSFTHDNDGVMTSCDISIFNIDFPTHKTTFNFTNSDKKVLSITFKSLFVEEEILKPALKRFYDYLINKKTIKYNYMGCIKGEMNVMKNKIFYGKKDIATVSVVKNYENVTFKPIRDVISESNALLLSQSYPMYELLKDFINNSESMDKDGLKAFEKKARKIIKKISIKSLDNK